MALPIWGLFMQKVYADPTIAIGKDDVFVPPLGWSVDLSCRGDESDLSSGSVDSNDTYFE